MKLGKAITTFALLTLTTLSFANSEKDFIGNYTLKSGEEGCYETLRVVETNGGECIGLAETNPGMGWAETHKICDVNGPIKRVTEDIPAPAFIGTITHIDQAIMRDSMILPADYLYAFTTQITEHVGSTTKHIMSTELTLHIIDSEDLDLNDPDLIDANSGDLLFRAVKTKSPDSSKNRAYNCIYERD